MSEVANYLCIGCPIGCWLQVEHEGPVISKISGHSCRRGEEFARQEHVDPRRVLTTTVRVTGGVVSRLPVRSARPVAKNELRAVCAKLHAITVQAPVQAGSVILPAATADGIDIVAARSVPAKMATQESRERVSCLTHS